MFALLHELKIENVAVIEKASVNFTEGFNVLTGETGAGKSILIDSINAILGNRTSRELVRTNAQKACIWATFSNLPKPVIKQLENSGYEVLEELLLYREISQDGKSMCRINGMPATATVVRDICADLINIHGQHDNQSLMNPQKHIIVLDAFAQNEKTYSQYYCLYKQLVELRREIKALTINENEKEQKLETLRYNIDEIEKAALKIGEEEELLVSKLHIKHSQSITNSLNTAYNALSGNDEYTGAALLLGEAAAAIESLSSITEEFSNLAEKLNDAFYTVKDLSSEINETMQASEFTQDNLDLIEERLDVYYHLKKKYNTDTLHILEYLDSAKQELENVTFADEKIGVLRERQRELYEKAKVAADSLTNSRLKAFVNFEKEMTSSLEFLNMPGIRLSLVHSTGALSSMGQDTIEFYISPNPGEAPKPLAKIASGGELSRIMLAIKSALADKDDIGTVIYDEIDTGVSGLAAGRIGDKLLQNAKWRQIICITHTAQIASKADTHLLIKKNIEQNKTYTEIIPLINEAREAELARIISGDKITEASIATAKEMLAQK